MAFLYNLGIRLYVLAVRIAAMGNAKAAKWLEGRKRHSALNRSLPPKKAKRIWFHISSLGEFEQAKPLLLRLKDSHELVITFFSPSGFESGKAQKLTEWVFYLPVDTRVNMKKCIKELDADLVVLVKYDFWYHLIHQCHLARVPVVAIAALFSVDHAYFKPYSKFFLNMLKEVSHFCTHNEETLDVLKAHGIDQSTLCGDTRVDSVVISQGEREIPESIARFIDSKPCLLLGSSYQKEESLVHEALQTGSLAQWKVIIAPHNIAQGRLDEIQRLYGDNCAFWSTINESDFNKPVLIIDSIGWLMHLYAKCDVAFVGGGFGKTVHNTLEPAAYGVPILLGPNFRRFVEAVTLVEREGAFVVKSLEAFNLRMRELEDESLRKVAGNKCAEYIRQNSGATDRTLEVIETFIQ